MFCSGFHEVPGQKIGQPDFPNGGDAVGEQKYAYERDGDDRHQRREHKQDLHKTFSEFFHKTSVWRIFLSAKPYRYFFILPVRSRL